MNKIRRLPLSTILIASVAALLIVLELFSVMTNVATPLQRVEFSMRDLLTRARGTHLRDNIVIVAIDDDSFNWTGYQWPWPRAYFAQIVDAINAGGAKVIGVDVFLSEQGQDPQGDQALADALARSNASVVVMQLLRSQGGETLKLPQSVIADAITEVGITPVLLDDDAIVRQVRAYDVTYDKQYFYHWAFQVARLFLGVNPPEQLSLAGLTFNGKRVPLNGGYLTVNFHGPPQTYPTYSAAYVVEGDVLAQNPDAFRNKIVLIGATTDTLQDLYATPYSSVNRMPGVEIVANVIDTIISGEYLPIAPPWVTLLLIVGMAALAGSLIRIKRPAIVITLLVAAMLIYGVAAFIILAKANWYIAVVSPELMLLLGVLLPSIEQSVSEELEKRRVRGMFTRFISPEMVNQLLETQDINALNKRSNITVLFSDIRGFTTLSEKLAPEQVVALLNPYLEAMTEVIYRHGGTVDKYEGDAIMAFFGEPVSHPDHALRAARTAVDMRIALDVLKTVWEVQGRNVPKFEMGIGLNSGDAFVGLLGSAQRINYTAIGDNVNLAARLQDLTKNYKWPIIISENTYQQIKDEFDAEFIEAVTVKGKTEAVRIYKLLGRKDAPPDERVSALNI
jgi:adenylate cyclase